MDLILYNSLGESIDLQKNDYCFLTNISGQTSIASNVASITIGGMDGDSVSNVQAQPRTVILDLRIKPGTEVEIAKRAILRVAKLKKTATLRWTQENKILELSGIVEAVDMPRWTNAVVMQITLHCEQPFWEDYEETLVQLNDVIERHYFTTYANDQLIFTSSGQAFGEINTARSKSFYNNGDAAVGMEIEIICLAGAGNPVLTNGDGQFFGFDIDFGAGEVIYIDTRKGQKSAKVQQASGLHDILSSVRAGSTWLQLEPGLNTLSISARQASTTNLSFNITYKQRYI